VAYLINANLHCKLVANQSLTVLFCYYKEEPSLSTKMFSMRTTLIIY